MLLFGHIMCSKTLYGLDICSHNRIYKIDGMHGNRPHMLTDHIYILIMDMLLFFFQCLNSSINIQMIVKVTGCIFVCVYIDMQQNH